MNKKTLTILIIVLVLLAGAVTTIVLVKSNSNKKGSGASDTLSQDSLLQDTGAGIPDSIVKVDSATGEVVVIKQEPEPDYLVMVNGHKITEDDFNTVLKRLSKDAADVYRKRPKGLLEDLVTEELILEEAERRGLGKRSEKTSSELYSALEKQVTSAVSVSESEIREYYEEHKSEMSGASFEQARSGIELFLKNQGETRAFDDLISSLRASVEISWNTVWLARHTADDPLNKALATGRPVVVDFGRGSCIPCKKMMPILQELQKEYKGKAEVLILDLDEYYDLARSVGIRVIPTQIFYDRSGNEVSRHVGFMEKQAIVDQLAKMGVN